jgi:hypothetical protein
LRNTNRQDKDITAFLEKPTKSVFGPPFEKGGNRQSSRRKMIELNVKLISNITESNIT